MQTGQHQSSGTGHYTTDVMGLNALQEGERQQKPVYFCCGPTTHQRANAAVLVRHNYPL